MLAVAFHPELGSDTRLHERFLASLQRAPLDCAVVASWGEIEAQAPELIASAREFFDAFVHKTLATLRRDGSPRISGSEVIFADGELWLGSMWQSRKALDLQRDPRFALHSGSPDPDAGWRGDAKLAGPRRGEPRRGAARRGSSAARAGPGRRTCFAATSASSSSSRCPTRRSSS